MKNEKDQDQNAELAEEELKQADGGLVVSGLADPRPSPILQPPGITPKKF